MVKHRGITQQERSSGLRLQYFTHATDYVNTTSTTVNVLIVNNSLANGGYSTIAFVLLKLGKPCTEGAEIP